MRATARSLPTRAITVFSGTVGVALKIAFLSIVNAIAIWAAVVLLDHHKWRAVVLLLFATAAIDAIYLVRRWTLPLKFLIPGTVFLLAFQVIPVIYTINVAFTNYSTGHILSKSQAIAGIKSNSLTEAENGKSYTMAAARDKAGGLVLVLQDEDTGKTYVGSRSGLRPLPRSDVTISEGDITGVRGYHLLQGTELVGLDTELSAFTVPVGGAKAIQPQGLDSAVVLERTLRYDPKTDEFIRFKDGAVFRDNGRGSFVSSAGQELEPGWKTHVGGRNFGRIIHSPLIRKPFLQVFVWTLAFATLVVLFSFALGLLLAITLNKPGLALQRTYRALLIIPYAVPAFLSLLVWQGLLNDPGPVNHLFHTNIAWLFDVWPARAAVILVSVWLTVPYFFLVSLGALQSIPAELIEAARVDGAGALQVFRKVTLPLLLVAVAPLMIASFAFNFNNFNNIYLLTSGGPAMGNSPIAGATDILISYTYKIAFAAGKGQDYGLASAIGIFIFFVVATISAVSFSRTKALENLA